MLPRGLVCASYGTNFHKNPIYSIQHEQIKFKYLYIIQDSRMTALILFVNILFYMPVAYTVITWNKIRRYRHSFAIYEILLSVF